MKAFDVTNMAISLLPVSLRRPVVCAILRSALSTLQAQHDTIYTAHHGTPYGTYYRLRHTGQVCSLESLLNDRFDANSRRITIGGSNGEERWYIYTEGELTLQPFLLTWVGSDESGPTYLYPDADYIDKVDEGFIVKVPSALRSYEASLRASLDDMKIAGVSYVIAFF